MNKLRRFKIIIIKYPSTLRFTLNPSNFKFKRKKKKQKQSENLEVEGVWLRIAYSCPYIFTNIQHAKSILMKLQSDNKDRINTTACVLNRGKKDASSFPIIIWGRSEKTEEEAACGCKLHQQVVMVAWIQRRLYMHGFRSGHLMRATDEHLSCTQ